MRYLLLPFLAAIVLLLVLYLSNRLLSSRQAVRLRSAKTTTPTPGEVGKNLRIATYNIAHGRGSGAPENWGQSKEERIERLTAIADLLRSFEADVVVLNEVDFDAAWSHGINQARLIAQKADFGFWVEERNMDFGVPFFSFRFGNAILSKHPLSDCQLVDYPPHATHEEILVGKKNGVICTVESEPTFRLLAVHLDHRSEEVRIRAAEVIKTLRDQSRLPVVAAGDFNSSPLGFPGAQMDRKGRTAMSVLLQEGRWITLPNSTKLTAPPRARELTFSSTDPRSVIDWILIPEDWSFVSKQVTRTELSDHLPVLVEVEATTSTASIAAGAG